jgi:hypothetical protein
VPWVDLTWKAYYHVLERYMELWIIVATIPSSFFFC